MLLLMLCAGQRYQSCCKPDIRSATHFARKGARCGCQALSGRNTSGLKIRHKRELLYVVGYSKACSSASSLVGQTKTCSTANAVLPPHKFCHVISDAMFVLSMIPALAYIHVFFFTRRVLSCCSHPSLRPPSSRRLAHVLPSSRKTHD